MATLVFRAAAALCVLWILSAPGASASERRFALLVGILIYAPAVGELDNPQNDVDLLVAALRRLRFEVTVVKDATSEGLRVALKKYLARVGAEGENAVSLFYYSGHGLVNPTDQVNYLIPTNLEAVTADFWAYSFSLDEVLNYLSLYAKRATHYVVFDACRNELDTSRSGPLTKGASAKGWGVVKERRGMLIAYATEPGKTASDEGEGGGPYATALAEEIVKPGVEAITMFRRVQLKVEEKIGQTPWLSHNAMPEFFFAGRDTPDAKAWAKIRNSQAVEDFRDFINQHPRSPYLDAARASFEDLKRRAREQVALAAWRALGENKKDDPEALRDFVAAYEGTTVAAIAKFELERLGAAPTGAAAEELARRAEETRALAEVAAGDGAASAPRAGDPDEAPAPEPEFLTGALAIRSETVGGVLRHTLVEDVVFRDSAGAIWTAPAGAVFSSARVGGLGALMGPPFDGLPTRAAALHDHYRTTRERDWRAVNRMFYEALVADGVSETLALVAYNSVMTFGPRPATAPSE